MAFIAFHFHWSSQELMGLDHQMRRTWCSEISAINRKLDQSGESGAKPIEAF
ncbi:conserved hypothetical protein [Rhodobacteraceae bacterium KLH11]|nr:conserved hypothetical protein [Rhodobacteraceae bacterium KLH11]